MNRRCHNQASVHVESITVRADLVDPIHYSSTNQGPSISYNLKRSLRKRQISLSFPKALMQLMESPLPHMWQEWFDNQLCIHFCVVTYCVRLTYTFNSEKKNPLEEKKIHFYIPSVLSSLYCKVKLNNPRFFANPQIYNDSKETKEI